MAKLRAYVANEGKVYDLIKYRKEKEKRVNLIISQRDSSIFLFPTIN
ncbi:MAG TPA: hypothetical protein VK982_09605 [Bacteroidales bacterium]|nr:hypothetical protein [Bacteroidales bacterium]